MFSLGKIVAFVFCYKNRQKSSFLRDGRYLKVLIIILFFDTKVVRSLIGKMEKKHIILPFSQSLSSDQHVVDILAGIMAW
jgi:hypothetical protein